MTGWLNGPLITSSTMRFVSRSYVLDDIKILPFWSLIKWIWSAISIMAGLILYRVRHVYPFPCSCVVIFIVVECSLRSNLIWVNFSSFWLFGVAATVVKPKPIHLLEQTDDCLLSKICKPRPNNWSLCPFDFEGCVTENVKVASKIASDRLYVIW